MTAASSVKSAVCTAVGDNQFDLYVNGTRLGGADDWHLAQTFDVRGALVSGTNVVALQATNVDGAAGVLATCRIDHVGRAARARVGSHLESRQHHRRQLAIGVVRRLVVDGGQRARSARAGTLGPAVAEGGRPSPYLRKTFGVTKAVARARVYATALGIYELWLNGKRVGLDRFAPGWTDYNKRVQVQTYDVTSLVTQGDNAVGAILGDGWFTGKIGLARPNGRYGRAGSLEVAARARVCGRAETNDRERRHVERPQTGPDSRCRQPRWRNVRRPTGDARLGRPGFADAAGSRRPHRHDRATSSPT